MSINVNYLERPLKISEIAFLLEESSTRQSTLCKSNKINKWAIYKPLSYNKILPITLAERKSVNMGLTPKEMTSLKDSAGLISKTEDEIKTQIAEWSYTKRPSGTSSSPYRLSDFLNSEGVSSMQGYNHNAVACDSDFCSFKKTREKATELPDLLVTNFSFRYDESSSSNINNANSNYMPLSYVMDMPVNDSSDTGWFLALIIYIESRNAWVPFIGTKAFHEATSAGELFPSLSSNPWGKDLLGNPDTIRYFPCLLRNPRTASTGGVSYITLSMNNSKAYCMPSGAGAEGAYTITMLTMLLYTSMFKFNDMTAGGTERSGYLLDGTLTIYAGTTELEAQYIFWGYDNYAAATTEKGWFVARRRVGSVNGYNTYNAYVIYATLNADDGKWYAATPTASYTANHGFYCTYTDAPSGGATPTRSYVWSNIHKTFSTSTRFSLGGITCYGQSQVLGSDNNPVGFNVLACNTPGTFQNRN